MGKYNPSVFEVYSWSANSKVQSKSYVIDLYNNIIMKRATFITKIYVEYIKAGVTATP